MGPSEERIRIGRKIQLGSKNKWAKLDKTDCITTPTCSIISHLEASFAHLLF